MTRLIWFGGWWLATWMGVASDGARDFSKYPMIHWGAEQGLPQQTITTVFQTEDGYLWIGTQTGVARFDGVSFLVLGNEKVPQLRDRYISGLVQGKDGTLWIGTSAGLGYYSRGSFGIYNESDGLVNSNISGLAINSKGDLWIGVDGGLARYTNRQFEWVVGLPNTAINGMVCDKQDRVWLGTNVGLRYIEDGVIRRAENDEQLEGRQIRALFCDRNGVIWAGVEGFGLARWHAGILTTFPFPAANEFSILSICENWEGGLWLGTFEKGLVAFQAGQYREYSGQDLWVNDEARVLFEGSEGHLWVGTRYGLKQFSRQAYDRIDRERGLPTNRTWTAYEDALGAVWIGTSGEGVVRYFEDSMQVYSELDGLPSNIVLSIYGQANGDIWVGTKKGLARITSQGVTQYADFERLPQSDIPALLVDRSGKVWVGSTKGLFLFHDQKVMSVGHRRLATQEHIRTIFEDRQGWIWVGTQNGLFLNKGKGFIDLGLEGIYTVVFEDGMGEIWIGSYNQGLLRWRQGEIKALTKERGLPSDIIFSILEDERNHLWMTSHAAFFKVPLNQIHQVLAGERNRVDSVSYGSQQDAGFGELLGGISPASWRGSNGRMLFPSSKGLIVFKPEMADNHISPPRVRIESLVVDDQPMPRGDNIKLPAHSRRLVFHYTALSFSHADKIKFQVQLQPLEQDWQDMEHRRQIAYFSIRPGKYQFKVRAVNAYGQWSEAHETLEFFLQPKFYETEFFLLICLIAAGLLLAGLHQLRLRKSESRRVHLEKLVQARTQALEASNLELQKVQDRLVRAAHYAGKAEIATDVLHSVGNALNSVVVSTSLLQEQTTGLKTDLYEKLVPLLEKYQGQLDRYLAEDHRGKRVLPTMRKMGQALRKYRAGMLAEIVGLQKMVHHVKQIIRDQQRHADIGMHFEIVLLDELVDEAIELQAGTLVATQVYLERDIQSGIYVRVPKIAFLQVLINLIKNACEASSLPAPEQPCVLVKAWLKGPGWVHMEISDRGLGIDETDITRIFRQGYTTKPGANGFGLHFCGNVISELKGQISVRSEGAGRGATFLLDLPVAQTMQ